MFISLLLISRATSTEELKCGSSLNPSNFSSRSAMEANGWEYSWTDDKEFWPEGSSSSYCEDVPATSYCGWCYGGCDGELSLTLELSGYEKGLLEIDYGSNQDSSGTSLFLNDEFQDSTTELSQTFDLNFFDGDTLILSEKYGVLIINGIDFHCFTSPPAVAPSESPSPRPSSYQTDTPIPTLKPNPSPTTKPYSPTSTPTIPTISPTPLSYPTDPVMAPTIVPTIKASKTTNMMLEPIHVYSILGTVILVLFVMIIFLLTRKKKTVKIPHTINLRQETFANTPALPDYSSDSSAQRLEGEEREGIPETGGFVTPPTITWSKSGNMHMRL